MEYATKDSSGIPASEGTGPATGMMAELRGWWRETAAASLHAIVLSKKTTDELIAILRCGNECRLSYLCHF